MFDFHLHSDISFDSVCPAKEILAAAEQRGLKEICFTDHYEYNDVKDLPHDLFSLERYAEVYGPLSSDTVKIRRGVEFGMTHWNKEEFRALNERMHFDFVIGSVHCAGGSDPYFKEYWDGITPEEGFRKYLLQTLKCVKLHDEFDVLGHINYACKSEYNPTKKPLYYEDYPELCDEIMRILVQKGKGMEINTSGMDRVGEFLPSITYLKRFKELGGEIVTIGSDAHNAERVGQYAQEALDVLREVFGYVCTFENRAPIFHKL